MAKTKIVTTINKITRIELSGEDLRTKLKLPPQSKVIVEVPGGGDWSHAQLSLDEVPLIIIWEETKVS